MSRKLRNSINEAADERGIHHQTALLIWECSSDFYEFIDNLDDFVECGTFVIID